MKANINDNKKTTHIQEGPIILQFLQLVYVTTVTLWPGNRDSSGKKKNIDKLNSFHKDMLPRIHHLPERTALPAVYGLVGQFPEEFELHRNQLTLFGNIAREDCIERELAVRQLSNDPVKQICVFEHSVMTNFNCACPAIQRGQGSGFPSEGSS